MRQPHSGILVLDRVRGQAAAEIAQLIDSLVGDLAIDRTNLLYDWTGTNGWHPFGR